MRLSFWYSINHTKRDREEKNKTIKHPHAVVIIVIVIVVVRTIAIVVAPIIVIILAITIALMSFRDVLYYGSRLWCISIVEYNVRAMPMDR